MSVIATLTGRSPAAVFNYLVPRQGIATTCSVPYADGRRRTLDVYRPKSATAVPVVVFFYGGSWQMGDKETYLFAAVALARRGYVAVLPDYRIYPDARYPDFIEDGARAMRWVKENIADFGGDPRNIVVMGHSAGAYIAAMLALDGRWLRRVGLAAERDIAGLVGIAGPYDFLPLRSERLATIFGGANEPDTQPISHVAAGAPPALLMTGGNDRVVDPGNTSRLATRLIAAGNKVTFVTYPRVGHFAIMAALAKPFRFVAPVLNDADRFIAGTAQTAARTADPSMAMPEPLSARKPAAGAG